MSGGRVYSTPRVTTRTKTDITGKMELNKPGGHKGNNLEACRHSVIIQEILENRKMAPKTKNGCREKIFEHLWPSAGRAASVLNQIQRSFHYTDKKTFMKLCKSNMSAPIYSSHFAVQAWSLWLKGDIERWKKYERRQLKWLED